MLSCCHFQSCTPRPLWIQYLPQHPRMGWKGFVLRGNCGRTGAARLKRTTCRGKELEEAIPASTVRGGKEKQVIHWGIKENSFLNCWDLSVSFKVISEKKTRCEANVLPHLSWYQQILNLDRISLQNTAPRDCGKEEGDASSTIFLKDSCKYSGWVLKLGRLTYELKLLQIHLFGQGVLEWLVRKCRWDWLFIKSLLHTGNPRLPYLS